MSRTDINQDIQQNSKLLICMKAQASMEMIAYVSIFLLIFVVGASIYLANIQKITQNTANEYSLVVLNSISNGFMLAKMTPSTQILVPIQPELPGNLGYRIELSKDSEGVVANLITGNTVETEFVFQKILYADGMSVTLLDDSGTLVATRDILKLNSQNTKAINITSYTVGGITEIRIRGLSR